MTDAAQNSLDDLKRRARRRLVGAAVLAIAAAVILPLVFEHEPPPLKSDVDVKIPPIEGSKFEPRAEPRSETKVSAAQRAADATPIDQQKSAVNAPADASVPPTVTSAAAASATVAAQNSPKPPDKPVEKPAPSAPDKSADKIAESKKAEPPAVKSNPGNAVAPDAKLPAAKRDGKHAVQIIAVRNVELVAPVLKKARDAGLPTYEEKITVQDGVVTRVRVGPYATRPEAERVVADLKKRGFEAVYAEVK